MIAAEHEIDGDLVKPEGDLDYQIYLPMAFSKLPFELAAVEFGDTDSALKFGAFSGSRTTETGVDLNSRQILSFGKPTERCCSKAD